MKKCPVCNSTRFNQNYDRDLEAFFMICRICGYTNRRENGLDKRRL